MPYARYRKSLISTEKTVEDNMLAKAAGMGRSKSMGGFEASSGFEALQSDAVNRHLARHNTIVASKGSNPYARGADDEDSFNEDS